MPYVAQANASTPLSGSFLLSPPRYSIRMTFFLLGVVSTMVYGLVCGVIFYRSAYYELREEFRVRGVSMARNLAFNATYGTLIGDGSLVLQLVDGFVAEPIVAYVRVIDDEAIVLAERAYPDDAPVMSPPDHPVVTSWIGPDGVSLLHIIHPVTAIRYEAPADDLELLPMDGDSSTTRIVGHVVIGISLASVTKRARGLLARLAWVILVLVIIGLGAAYVLSGALAEPIAELADAAIDVANGNLERRVEVRGEGELAMLARSFNRMASSLDQRNDELSRTASRLEDMVRLRTEQLRGKADQLEQRNVQLLRQNERIREADRLKSEFLATMSHELRTPLNSIIGFSGMLLQLSRNKLEDDEVEDLISINKSGRHLLSIISSIIDISRVEAGRLELHRSRVEILDVVQDVVRSLILSAQGKGLIIDVNIPAALPPVWADATRLWQIMENLVSNAVKYSERGTITISAAETRGDPRHGEVEDLPFVRIEVKDEGIGIASADLDSIFQIFRQVDSSTTRRQGGLGLGLAIVRRLVESHGGHMEVSSIEGVGSVFSFSLPVAEGAVDLDREVGGAVGCDDEHPETAWADDGYDDR